MRLLLLSLIAAGVTTGWAQQKTVSNSLAHSLNDAFADVYEKISPTVVVIEVRSAPQLQGLPSGLNFFFRGQDGRPLPSVVEQGSGFIVSPKGYIVTNFHVVQGAENGRITVQLKDGRKFPAELVGIDEQSDLAVIKIKADNLPVAELADSSKVRVGQFAFAIGAPFDLPYTFTVGIVSATGRTDFIPDSHDYQEYLQTDAAINPGNSGGPLCDIDGRVVGVNTLISGMNQGLGFAVPANIVKRTMDQLIANGKVSRPYLGIAISGLLENERARTSFPNVKSGVLVEAILPLTPAYDSDLRPGDIILKVDGVAVERGRDLQREILEKKVGQLVQLDIIREGRSMSVSLPTAEQPVRMVRASNRLLDPSFAPDVTATPPGAARRPDSGNYTYGLSVSEAPPAASSKGVVVDDIEEGSPAATSDLLRGDIIVEAGGRPVRGMEDFANALKQSDLSRGIMLSIDRHGQKTFAILKP